MRSVHRLAVAGVLCALAGVCLLGTALRQHRARVALQEQTMAPLLSRPARTQSLKLKDLISNVVSNVKAKVDTVKESVATQGIRGTLSDIIDDGKINNLDKEAKALMPSTDPDAPGPKDGGAGDAGFGVDEPGDDPGDSVPASLDEIGGDGAGGHAYPSEDYNIWDNSHSMFDNAEVTQARWRHANVDPGVSQAGYAAWFAGHT